MKAKSFNIHFNRNKMKSGDSKVWTVHTSKQCLPVEEIKCYVPLQTTFNSDGPQPRARLKGKGNVYIKGSTAFIIDDIVVNYMDDDDYFEAISGEEV